MPKPPVVPNNEELLNQFLSLPRSQREERFITTSRAADLTGLSIRTIQVWVECGYVQSLTIGKKYRIDRLSLIKYLSDPSQESMDA